MGPGPPGKKKSPLIKICPRARPPARGQIFIRGPIFYPGADFFFRGPLGDPMDTDGVIRLRHHSNAPLRLRNAPLVACTTSCRRVVLLKGPRGPRHNNTINSNK